MKAVLNKIRLDMTKPKIRTSVSICKGDTNSRQICITLVSSGVVYEIPDNSIAVLLATKPDGKKVYNDCSINGNEIIFDVTTQLIASSGDVECQVELSDAEGTILTSPAFVIRVYEKLLDNSVMESINEYKALTAFCTNAENAAVRAENNAEQIEEQLKATGKLLSEKEEAINVLANVTVQASGNANSSAEDAQNFAVSAGEYASEAKDYAERLQLDVTQLSNYVASAQQSAENASAYADVAISNKTASDTSASNAATSERNAKASETAAKQYEESSSEKLNLCIDYADEASEYADRANNRASEAGDFRNQAEEFQSQTEAFANTAKGYMDAAGLSATNAATSENNAKKYAEKLDEFNQNLSQEINTQVNELLVDDRKNISELKGDLGELENGKLIDYGAIKAEQTNFFEIGVNKINEKISYKGFYGTDGYWNNNDGYRTFVFKVKPNTTYTVWENAKFNLIFWKKDVIRNGFGKTDFDNFISAIGYGSSGTGSKTITTPIDCEYVSVTAVEHPESVDAKYRYQGNIMAVEGEVYPSEYYPYEVKFVGEIDGFEKLKDDVSELKGDAKVKCLFLGDSITALDEIDRGWVKYFREIISSEKVGNVAVASAVLTDYQNTALDGNPITSEQSSNTLSNQVYKVINGNYDTPDVIIIAIGTNGGIDNTLTDERVYNGYYNSDGSLISVDDCDRKTTVGAFRYANEKLHEKYPNALIFWCVPIMGFENTRSVKNVVLYEKTMERLTGFAGMPLIHTNRCFINGINEKESANGEYLIDGLHPNAKGAKMIGYFNACEVKKYMQMIKCIKNS